MSFRDDLAQQVATTFRTTWVEEETAAVPAADALRLDANHAKDLKQATVLYADLDGSTDMVDSRSWMFSAEVYKTYLRCAAQIVRREGGAITAYDGDRLMAIFTGDYKNTNAVRCALRINSAVLDIIQPALSEFYRNDFQLKHVVGVDTSQLRVARIGVRGDNDLVWVGRAANYAAKLTALQGKATWITKAVYDSMTKDAKYAGETNMWEERRWTAMSDMTIYCSNYKWSVS